MTFPNFLNEEELIQLANSIALDSSIAYETYHAQFEDHKIKSQYGGHGSETDYGQERWGPQNKSKMSPNQFPYPCCYYMGHRHF